jgi:hypothetical protein
MRLSFSSWFYGIPWGTISDYSLLIFEEDKLIAVLPANRVSDTVYSHQGLTYGGLVYYQKQEIEIVAYIIDSICLFLRI